MTHNLLQKTIIYREKPTFKDEQDIALLVEQAMEALNSKNPERIASVYFPDATLMLPFGNKTKFITPIEFVEKVKKFLWPIGKFSLTDVVIRVRGETSASVFGTIHFMPRANYREQVASRIFVCSKRNGIWKFISSHNL